MALDINSGAELVVNRDGVVVKARPLNQEAKSLLADVRVDGQDVYGAVESIVREAGRRRLTNLINILFLTQKTWWGKSSIKQNPCFTKP